MAASAGSVSIDLDAKIASFESDMGRAAKLMERDIARAAKTSQRAIADMEKAAKAAGVALGTAMVAGATAAAYAIKSAINAMDDMSKAAQRVGTSTEGFSKLAYAGSLADVAIEDLQSSLGRLAKAQAEALKSTSKQAEIFGALGISVTDTEGKLRSTTDVLMDFADAFQRQQGSPEIIAAGLNIFGRSFQNLIPMLKDGSAGLRDAGKEAEELGVVLSTQAGQQAEHFNDNLTRLQTAAQGLALRVASDLLPELIRLTDRFVETAKSGQKAAEIAKDIEYGLQGVAAVAKFAWVPFKAFGDVVEGATMGMIGFAEAARGVASMDWDQIKRGMAVAQQGADLAYYGEDKARKRDPKAFEFGPTAKAPELNFITPQSLKAEDDKAVADMRRARAESERLRKMAFGDDPKTARGSSSKRSPRQKDAPNFSREDEQATRAAIQAAADAEAQFKDLAASLAGPLAQAEREHQKNLEQITLLGKTAGKSSAEVAALKEAETLAYKAETVEINAQLHPAQAIIAEMKFENDLIRMGNVEREIAIAQRRAHADAISAEGKEIAALVESQNAARQATEFSNETQRQASDALADWATGTKSAKQAFGDFADDLYRRAIQVLADRAVKALFSAFSTGGEGGEGGGFFSSLFSGSSPAPSYGGGRASGGSVSPNMFYEVNENMRTEGPELFSSGGRQFLMTGSQGGTVTPQRGGAGGMRQTNNFILQASRDTRTQDQIAAKIAFQTSRVSRRNT